MKFFLVHAALAAIATISFNNAVFAAEAPYVDDRSSPEAVIRSLYSAINRNEYARAWAYFGETKPSKDFDTFVSGYEGTSTIEIEIGNFSEEGAAGSVFFSLPVAIRAKGNDGSEALFAGCYTLRQVNAQAQEPPYNPIHIEKGALKPVNGNLEDAVPESCGDGPLPPQKDVLLDKAKKAFATIYIGKCTSLRPEDGQQVEPVAYTIRYKNSQAGADATDREVRLFRFSCTTAAYNESSVYYISDDFDSVRQLQFSIPELDIRYVNGDTNGKVEEINIIGFQTNDALINADYDETTHMITSFNKWRGVGDASSSAIYLFRNGIFSLVQYDVDASYDGKINPQTVLDYNTAP